MLLTKHSEKSSSQPRDDRASKKIAPGQLTPANDSIWLLNHAGATVLCCPILETFETGLRLRMPAGYGVAIGQRYEVLPAEPGQHAALLSGLTRPTGHWVGVIELAPDPLDDQDHVEVGVVFEDDGEGCTSAF